MALPLQSLIARERAAWPLLRVWSLREFRARYRQHALDVFWGVLSPVVTMATYGVVIVLGFKATVPGIPYLSFAWTGMVLYTFFATALAAASASLVYSSHMITKVYFPREVVPLAVVGASVLDLVIATGILFALVMIQGIGLSVTALAIVPVYLVLVLWTAALSVFAASLTVFIRDVGQAIALLLRVVFFACPVMYAFTILPQSLWWTAKVIPLSFLIEATRDAVLRHVWPNWGVLAIHGLIAAALLVLAVAYTRSVESRMVDVV